MSAVMDDPRTVEARARLLRWREDPLAFARECFDLDPFKPDAWQVEGLQAFPHSERLAFKACKGPGKTALLAVLIWNFLATRPFPKVAATSITEDNLTDNLWPELAKWQRKSRFLSERFTWTKTRVVCNDAPEDWFATARTWPKSADPQRQADTLAGIHADNVMFVLDESGGIPQAVMTTAEAVLASGKETKVVQAGNPTHTSGPLYRACTVDRKLWHVITITGDPDDPKRSTRIKLDWAQQQIASYGRDNPWVQVNVLGQFPPASINALLGVEDVEAAMRRKLSSDAYDWVQKRLGIDVARFGDDRTVFFCRQGRMTWIPTIIRNENTAQIAAKAARAITKWASVGVSDVLTLIDDTGHWGHGVLDNLVQWGGYPVLPIIYSDPAANKRYANKRAANWSAMADWVKAGGALPNMPELVPELTEVTYSFTPAGQFLLEDKKQLKARLGFSPDLADALANTFELPDMPAEMVKGLAKQNYVQSEFDPFAAPMQQGGQTSRHISDFDPFEVTR